MSLDKNDELEKEINAFENEKKMLNHKTLLVKNQFIDEIKNGLGEQIKNSDKFEVVKPSIWKRIGKIIKNIFIGFKND